MTTKTPTKTSPPTSRQFPTLAHTPMRLIHGDHNLTRGLERIEDWTRARDQLLLLDQTAPQPRNVGSLMENLEAFISGGLDSGDGVPADIAALAADAKAQIETAVAVQEAVDRTRQRLSTDLDLAVRSSRARVYAGLHEQLVELVDEVKALGDLDEIRTAEAAIASGRTEEYGRLGELEAQYRSLRESQARMLRIVDEVQPRWVEATLVENVTQIFPAWKSWKTHGYVETRAGRRKPVEPPWPDDPRSLAFVEWALRAGARLWVPTSRELADAEARLREIFTADADEPARPMVVEQPAAEDRDYQDPGRKPTPRVRRGIA